MPNAPTILLRLTVEQVEAVKLAITLCIALSPRDVELPEARAMGEVVGLIENSTWRTDA